jgi:hypothetical protein
LNAQNQRETPNKLNWREKSETGTYISIVKIIMLSSNDKKITAF